MSVSSRSVDSASSSSPDSESEASSSSSASASPRGAKRSLHSSENDSDHTSPSDDDSEDEDLQEEPVLSHAEQRRQKKKQQKATVKPTDSSDASKEKQAVKNTAELAPSKIPKRQNSVWVGNMTFKTTPDALRRFFEGVGEITRVHMPMKLASAGPGGQGTKKENRGFAYVDFATPDAKILAITLSENPLDGRRLLIKDGDSFEGRPTPSAQGSDAASSTPNSNLSGHTKTAQKILSAQKQPAGPTLFLGNLGFEATEQSIRALLESHRAKPPADVEERTQDPAPWIRKVRLGTFEDSGKCKGWAFVDFRSTDYATSALVDPKNHFLDGRKLVVEYASPDAVRRGGGPGHARDKKPRGDTSSTTEHGPRRQSAHEADRPQKRKPPTEADAEGEDAEQGQDAAPKRRRTEGDSRSSGRETKNGKPPRARTKPGAALALAKRETAAIVPSQGKKIVF